MKILVIEDEQSLLQSIEYSLLKEQYLVETATDFAHAAEKLAPYDYDCVLLDIMLPGGSGLELLKQLTEAGKSKSVIIISAKDSLDDKVAGLELGADDYLTKPFHLVELNARVKALLRRKLNNGSQEISIGNTTLALETRQLFVEGKPITLNRKEFDILHYFMVNKDRLITKNALAEHVWGDYIDQADSYDFIYSQIKNTRKKLSTHQASIEIESIYGIGYKLSNK